MALILIIEDSQFQAGKIAALMAKDKHKAVFAANGKEGLEKIVSEKPDVILMDVVMPDMDGIEALEEIKKMGTKTPVIIVSADIQETTRKKCLNLGAVDFINKPLIGESADSLRHIVGCYLPENTE